MKWKYEIVKADDKHLSIIAGNIATLQDQGINMMGIFELLIQLPINKQYKSSLIDIRHDIKTGKSLEEAFLKHPKLYPDFFTSFISIGEKYGKLSEVLKSIEDHYKQKVFIRKTITDAATYPLFILATIVVLVFSLTFFVLPNMYQIFNNIKGELPVTIRFMMSLNNLVKERPIFIASTLISWLGFLPIYLSVIFRQRIFTFIGTKLKVVKKINELTIISMIAIIYKSGVSLNIGLRIAIDSFTNIVVKEQLERIYCKILLGNSLKEAMEDTRFFSAYVISIVKLAEESGDMEGKFISLQRNLEETIIEKIKRTLSIIQPLMILIMSSVVGAFLCLFVLPIFTTMLGSVE